MIGHGLGVTLGRVRWVAQRYTVWRPRPGQCGWFLGRVYKLVDQQSPSHLGRGRVPAGIEHDVIPSRVGESVQYARRVRREVIGMDADAAEILAEVRLHREAMGPFEWLPWGRQNLIEQRPA
jgi:hypothetical protein